MCIEKCKRFFTENKLDIVIVLFLFLMAFGIRVIPRETFIEGDQEVPELETGGLMGFDTFWDARWTKHIAQGGWFPTHASMTNYPWGRSRTRTQAGWWIPNALIYRAMGGPVEPFDFGLLGGIMSWMNAISGALAVVFIYLLGKNLYNRTTGLASGLFLAAMSANLFYSIFGHAENDATGLMLFFLGLLLFVLTVKRRSWKYGIGTTLALGWLTIVWQAYNVALMLVGGTIALYFLIYGSLSSFGYYKESEERKKTRKWMIYGCVFVLLSILIEPALMRGYTGYGVKAILPVGLALLIGSLVELFKSKGFKELVPNFTKPKDILNTHYAIKGLAISIIFLLTGGLVFGSTIVTGPAEFVGVDLGIGEETEEVDDYRISQTIAEQRRVEGNMIERIDQVSDRFGILIWLAFLAAIILFGKLFMMPFVRNDFNYEWDILALAFIFLSLALLTRRMIEMFFLSGAVALGAGYFFGLIKRMIDYGMGKHESILKYKKYLTITLFLVMILTFFSNATLAVNQSKNYSYDVYPEWQETMNWMNQNETVEKGSVFTAWWDYGHWMNYFSGDKVFVTSDNIKDIPSSVYTTASAFTHAPDCEVEIRETGRQPTLADISYNCETDQDDLDLAEKESLSLLKPLHTDYIIIDKQIVAGRTGGKWNALQTIAQPEYQDPNLPPPCFQTLPCERMQEEVVCGGPQGLRLNEYQWEQFKRTEWPGISLEEQGLDTRAFGREDSQGPVLYMSGAVCGEAFFQGGASSNTPTMYTFAHRMFFKDDSLKHVDLVYENDWLVVYETKNMDEIPHPSEFTRFTQMRHDGVLPPQPEELPTKD